MKGFFERHSISFITAIISFAITLLAVLASTFCFFNGHMDIPLGFLLGGVIIGGLYLLSALAEKIDDKKEATTFTIGVIALRLFILIGVAIIIAFMYYRWNLPYFNLFTYVASYTAAIIINIIVHLISKK